jgi:type I restriction enzyme S subunit
MASAEPTAKAGWEVKTLGEVLSVIKNGVNCKQNKDGKGVPISRIETIAQANIDYDRVGYAELSESDKVKYRLERGDILFSHINSAIHVGKTAILESEDALYHGVNLLLMRCHDAVMSRYLNLFLSHIFAQGYWARICKQSVNQASVNQSDVKKVPIPVPPLAEQERIVGILDEAFEGIAAATAQAEKNLHNARELFQSVLQSTFSQKGDDWVEAELDEITESTQIGLVRNKKSQGEDLPYRYVKMNNIGNDNTYNETDMVSVNADAVEVEKFSLRKGDLLFNTRNSHELVGKSCIYQSDSDLIALYNNNIMRIRFLENIKEEFAAFAFSSKQAVDQLDSMVSGTTNVAAIYYKSLRHLKIPVPPLPTQQAIVEKLDALSEETKALEAIYKRKQSALAELKQSLLQKAFAGAL